MRLQRTLTSLILLIALGITGTAIVILIIPESNTTMQVSSPTMTLTPTQTLTPSPTSTLYMIPTYTPFPTAGADVIATSIARPLNAGQSYGVGRDESPYTINDEDQRPEIVFYTVRRGDTIDTITQQFGLEMETLVWSNRRFYVNALLPGFVFTILPVNGALQRVQEPITIQALADQYLVDPYVIIDSDYNDLKGALPENILPIGLEVVIPGGRGSREPLYYEPPNSAYIQSDGDFGRTGVWGGTAVFGLGQPGSCGEQTIYGGTMPSTKPTSGYILTIDYSADHKGVDLAAREGTPVTAVGGGTVIFSGWSTWGYGYTVVIAHGPVMSLYAHMTGTVVFCGQQVTPGQYIGNVGNSGNSLGPHLHFEIRNVSGIQQNPHDYLGL